MNTTLFNPFLRICRAAEETPEGGGPPAPQQPEDTPPAQPPAPGEEQAPPNPDNPGEAAPESGEVDFSLDAPPPDGKEQPGDETEPGNPEDSKEPEKPYELELPDDLDVTDDFKATLKEHAKASGLEGKAAGKFVSGVIKSMQEAEQANIAATTKELREDWGKNFNANMKSVKEFAGKLKQKSGLTTEDLAPLQSPKGYRLFYALMKSVGEDAFVSGKEAQPEDPQKEAQRMLTDPVSPLLPSNSGPQRPPLQGSQPGVQPPCRVFAIKQEENTAGSASSIPFRHLPERDFLMPFFPGMDRQKTYFPKTGVLTSRPCPPSPCPTPMPIPWKRNG